jgi:Phage tail sheath protein subtilisin-like domain/Phage tail sheath C-terminal domain
MPEMIIPGTYIEVRAEGLVSAGRIATGIVGVVGTAASGQVGRPVTLAGFANAREIFGVPDDFDRPDNGAHPLTLVRALEHIYNNGASSVVAVRIAGSSQSNAAFAVRDDAGRLVATLTAKTPGSWGNDMRLKVDEAEDDCRIEDETHTDSFARLNYVRIVPSAENRIRIFRRLTKRIETLEAVYKSVVGNEEVTPNVENKFILSSTPVEAVVSINVIRLLESSGALVREYKEAAILYGAETTPPPENQIRINSTTGEILFAAGQAPGLGQKVVVTYAVGHAAPTAGQVVVTVWDGSLDFPAGEEPQQANGDMLVASYLVARENCAQVSLTYGTTIERFIVPDGRILAQRLHESSTLATAVADATHGDKLPKTGVDAYFGTGANTPGSNGAEAGREEYIAGLETLANELINIVVLAGQDAETMGSVLLGHLNATEQTDHERIGVIGAKGDTVPEFLGHSMASDRIILVAPGVAYPDGPTLPPAYTAAAVAGLISSVSVQTSLTNKTLTVPGLAASFNRGQQEQLIKRNVLAVIPKNGFRIVKGVTTSGEGTPFSAIPTRRIVDFAKYGVRSAANPYIGRLNNTRVRAALKATLDAFLTRMVQDEALTGYELEVTATRAQEIAGEVSVVMTLQPTFSIDFIRVTMILK